MYPTKVIELTKRTINDSAPTQHACRDLIGSYESLIGENRLGWSANLQLKRRLGSGGQGAVYLAERIGADDFCVPVAVKIFSPERYGSLEEYDLDMGRMGKVSAQIARIQHDNLLAIDHFLDRDRIRIMVMEWIEGFDLRRLMTARMYGTTKDRVSRKRWNLLNQHVVTSGAKQPRLRTNAALTILRDCLQGLSALHCEGIVHGDIKPANVMLKKSGSAKIIDMGNAHDFESGVPITACTPAYAAPSVLEGQGHSEASDLVSLGYLATELLSGRPLFDADSNLDMLLEEKKQLPRRLAKLLPDDLDCLEAVAELLIEMLDAGYRNESSAEYFLASLNSLHDRSAQGANLQCWVEEMVDVSESG